MDDRSVAFGHALFVSLSTDSSTREAKSDTAVRTVLLGFYPLCF